MQLSRTPGALHASTEDPGAATTDPVARPKPGERPVRWYRDTKPRFYRPYLIRVLRRDDTSMEFVFLDGNTGADLALSRPSYEIAYHDGRYAYSALPSTAPKVQPGSGRSCGLLFMTDLYIQALPRADRTTLLTLINDDDKWPRSAGTQLRPRTDLLAQAVATAPRPIQKRRKRAA
jgi:hypothetical protein